VREQRTGRNHTNQPQQPTILHNAAIACWGGGFFRRVLKWSPFVRSLSGVPSSGVGISVRFFLSAHGNFGICIKVICQERKFY
jgi:hypothetical protein